MALSLTCKVFVTKFPFLGLSFLKSKMGIRDEGSPLFFSSDILS